MRDGPPALPEPVEVGAGPAVRVTVFTTGWIAVRTAHREFAGPDRLAVPAVLAGRSWTEWMPINAFLVEHPRGTLLVDTGEAPDRPPGWFGCGSPSKERFYRRHLRITVPPAAALPRQLARHGVPPAEVDTVVITHLHSDHTGNLDAFPRARVVVGAAERGRYPGATHCRLPAGSTAVEWREGGIGGFPRSHCLTDDGTVRSIPLPGHTPGHQGLLVHGSGSTIVVGGDAAFTHDQIRHGPPPGIAVDRAANRDTQAALAGVLDAGGTVLLSHLRPAS